MTDSLKRTPLHGFHMDHNARMVPFAGWEMPVQYRSILEEHRAVRSDAGLFDVSHMGEARVHGAGALPFLQYLLTNDISRIPVGKALYSPMCLPDGGVVDDLLVYRVGDEEFLLCLNAANTSKDLAHMQSVAESFDCIVDDVSDDFALLALQGPRALSLFEELSGMALSGLRRFHFIKEELFGSHALISRTGYTGEDGLELYLPSGEAARIANLLIEGGKDFGLQLAGLGARDSLRLEAGLPLFGHEISAEVSPLAGGIGWTVKWNKKEDFIGRAALAAEKEKGPSHRIRFFTMEDRRIARPGTPVMDGEGNVCGNVVSGTLSPMTNQPIGSALIRAGAPAELYAQIRGRLLPVHCKKPPLHLA